MPLFKRHEYYHQNKAGAEIRVVVAVNIDSGGVFYGNLPDYLADAFGADREVNTRTPAGRFRVSAATFADFSRKIDDALRRYMEPEITTEHVIQYNIESHVSFATDADGNIFPNAGYPGAEWGETMNHNGAFGGHHAANPSEGGYSLKIGARAMTKTTIAYGEKKTVRYDRYYKGGSNFGQSNPAELLNSWCSMTVGNRPKEIPYTDESALFFHRLLLGMATLNRQIQQATFDQENLLHLIQNQSKFPLLGKI